MTYPRNSANPPTFDVGQVVQISDGVVQSSGVSVQVKVGTGSFGAGAGTLAYDSNTGIWNYTPTQAETDAETFIVQIYKTGCYSASVTVSTDDGTTNVTKIAGQPTSAAGAVSFPGTIASTTNITQATGITVQTNNDKTDYTISSAGIASFWSALTTGFTTVGSIGKLFVDTLDATISSRSTYAGTDTPGTSQLLGRLTAPRATNLDFLDAAISTVLSTINGLNNLSALANIYGASSLEIPDTGSTDYAFTIVVRDNEGKLVNLDTTPTVTAANAAGTSRSANLSAVSNPSTGRYIFTYSVASTHPPESLRIMGSGTVSGEARYVEWVGNIVNYDTLTTLQAVQTTVNAIDTRLPAALVNGRIASYVGEMAPSVITAASIATSALNGKGDWALASNWTAGRAGYLDLVLLANNPNQRTVTLTGNGHVPSVLHDAEPNSIPEDAFQIDALSARVLANDAVTEVVTGVWSANLSGYGANTAGKNLFDTLANTASLLSRIPAATTQLVTDLALMLVGSGTALVKWTVNALSNAPAGGGGGTIVATVAVPQLLEQTAFELQAIVVYRGCHWSFQIQDLGDLGGYTEIWFTLRKRQNDKDEESAVQISLTQGLLVANKSNAVTPTDASLTTSGQNVTIQVKQAVTQFVEPSNNYNYDLKGRNAAGQTIMLHESDKFTVKRDVTRKVS